MFKWIEYDTFISKIQDLELKFEKIDNMLNYTSNEEVVTSFQNEVISIGNLIERHMDSLGDDNRDIITDLESICEYIYEWFICRENVKKKIQIRESIKKEFSRFYKDIRNHRPYNDLSVCVIIKDEAKYIEEWLEYHLYYGVKKFYIYDNESTDNIKELLAPYIEEGIVEYKSWPGTGVQLSAYNDVIKLHKDNDGYIAFIDADEFLTPVSGNNIVDIIDDIMLLNFHSGAIGVNWRMYGSSGHEYEPDGLLIDNYYLRAEDFDSDNSHIKTIANPRRIVEFASNSHEAVMRPGYFCISENGSPIVGPMFYESTCNKLRVNHYFSKSKESFIKKHKRGWPDQPHYIPSDFDIEYKFNKLENRFNAIEDRSAGDISDVIQNNIEKRKVARSVPLFTIITTVYNNTKYLMNCVNSVLSQDYTDFEYIIIDDGSTDDTPQLCDEIEKSDNRIRVIHQKNQWIYASFNNAIREAKGKYVYMVNSDDILEPGALSRFADIIEKYGVDVIWTAVQGVVCDENQNHIDEKYHGLSREKYHDDVFLNDSDALHKYWRDLHYYGFTVNQVNVYNTEICKSTPFRNDVFGADGFFNLSIAEKIKTSYILADPVYIFYSYESNEFNASIGKAYGYEFSMFREMFGGHIELVKKWGGDVEDLIYFENILVSTCLNCLQVIENPKFNYSANEKIRIMLEDYFTPDFFNDVKYIDCFEEVDARITKQLIKYSLKNELLEDDDYYFFKEMIDSLNANPKTEKDFDNIEKAINHPLNPCNFGVSICRKKGLI
ncbi:MAG: glycosyltransferase [Oscillospiraceae bacterium]|nr:glycosyltransferase [Oscillospiraceae bacterium]